MERKWWKEGIIYQIYPQSFFDTNGDGVGDIPGIISKLDYIQSLGVDIIWLNPIYDSPLDDNGYDIRDYRKLNPMYGTMEQFDELLSEVHKRDLKLIMDLVVNHSSDEHAWFVQSRSSKDSPYRDYYYWRKGNGGNPPNNWKAIFGGSVWEYDETTDEYYLHYFSKKQPDLNWENPKVRTEVYDLINWWLEKGIDGFRLDVISMISKHLDFPDAPDMPFGQMFTEYYCNGPRVHEFIREMCTNSINNYDVMTVGEGPGITAELGNLYTGKDRGELNIIFPLDLMFVDWGPEGKFDFRDYDLGDVKAFFRDWNTAVGDDGWMSVFLDNHDFARMVSRWGDDGVHREQCSKCLLTMLLTLRGTPSIHYGSEIGMTNVAFDSIDDYRDIESLNFYREATDKGMAPQEALRRIQKGGRDNVRTPMQWSDEKHGGFSTGEPWLRSNPNAAHINVEAAEADRDSILHYFRRLARYRREHDVLVYGTFEDRAPDHPQIFHYTRTSDEEHLEIILNMSGEHVAYDGQLKGKDLVFGNMEKVENNPYSPWEARIYREV